MKKPDSEKPQQVFLFVNKDSKSKSLSKSEGDSAKEINRHAQKVRNRRLAVQKASTAQHSSASARRIALGGWKKKEGEDDSPPYDKELPQLPIASDKALDFNFNAIITDQDTTPISLTSSESSSRSSGSPPATSPDEPPTAVPELVKSQKVTSADIPRSDPNTQVEISRSDRSLYIDIPKSDPSPPLEIDRRNIAAHFDSRLSEEVSQYGDDNTLVLRPHLRAFSPHDQADPFNQLPVQISYQVHQVLQNTLRIYPYSGNNYKLAHLPDHIRSNIRQFPIAEVVQRAVTAPHHLYSLMACISIRLQGAFKEQIPHNVPKEFQRYASHHLQKELTKSSRAGHLDVNTILDILFLVVGEMGTGDYDSAREHLRVVSNVYHLLDLSKNLDFWVSESCAHVDNQVSMSTGLPPVFEQTFDPGPLLPERKAALQRELQWLYQNFTDSPTHYPSPTSLVVRAPPKGLHDAIADFAKNLDLRMGLAFEKSLTMGLLSPLLTPIVSDIVECVAIAKVVWLSPMAVCFDAEWLCRKARATLRRLLVIAPENNIGPLDVLGKCMEVVRCTLLIAMSHACTLIGAQTAKRNVLTLEHAMAFALKFWAPVMGLTQDMEPLDKERPYPTNSVLTLQIGHILYNSMVGLFSADLPGYESTHEYFMGLVVNCCKLLGIGSYHELREHMVQFLYSPSLQEKSLRDVALRLGQERLRVVDEV